MKDVDSILAAAKAGDLGRVTALLDADPVLATASTMLGSQAIHAAHFAGHREVVELLLRRGVELDVFLAAQLGIIDRVKTGGDVRAFDSGGSTALHGACYWGQTAV